MMKTHIIILLILLFFGCSVSASAFDYKAGDITDQGSKDSAVTLNTFGHMHNDTEDPYRVIHDIIRARLRINIEWIYSLFNESMTGDTKEEGNTNAPLGKEVGLGGNLLYAMDISCDFGTGEKGEGGTAFNNFGLNTGQEEGCFYALEDSEVLEKPNNDTGGTSENGINPVPEPATLLLLGIGLLGFSSFRRKKNKLHA